MNPIHVSQYLKTTLRDYITTTFDVDRDSKNAELADTIEAGLLAPEALSKGPYLEITPPYTRGASMRDLIADGVLSSKWQKWAGDALPLSLEANLYQHQETAIRRLTSGHNIVVSSGTGSGKTETFLIPILDDLLKNPQKGVCALLVYPLNALVNDQLERLRKLLRGQESITFGRYTSELDYKLVDARRKYPDAPDSEVIAREQIHQREKLPNILITNYAMLEYLLLRPEDSPLFESGLWRYIVLDEAHTYAGAQGFEVSMLLKRLKHRLGKKQGDVRCIATSATLTGDNKGKAVQFAKRLFDEPFEEEDIIFGTTHVDLSVFETSHEALPPETYVQEGFYQLVEEVRKPSPDRQKIVQWLTNLKLVPDDLALSDIASPHLIVWEVMRRNTHLHNVRRLMHERHDTPIAIQDIAEQIFDDSLRTEEKHDAIHHLIELGTFARETPDTAPLLPARYHFLMRSPQGVSVCLNPNCGGKTSSQDSRWSRVFTKPRERCDVCECLVYPIHICRDCGQTFLAVKPSGNGTAKYDDTRTTHYYVWEKYQENSALKDEDEDEATTSEEALYQQEEKRVCLRCGCLEGCEISCRCQKNNASPAIVTLYRIDKRKNAKEPSYTPYEDMEQCPRCLSKGRGNTKIATPIGLEGNAPLATLTYALYRQLPTSSDDNAQRLPGNGRKLLTFYDSRQGAARFAAYLQNTITSENYQHLVPLVLRAWAKDYLPTLKDVAEKLVEEGIRHRIFHNDPDLEFWRKEEGKPSSRDKDKLTEQMMTQLLAEVTTKRNYRQYLENLGLVAVEYFNEEQLPDFDALAQKLALTSGQVRVLVTYLLDELRAKKVLTFPEGVKPDDKAFGTYEGHPTIVRGNADPKQHQQPWIGKTERQSRRRYIARLLETNEQPHNEEQVTLALNAIFDWLTHEKLLVGKPSQGYRIDHTRISLDGRRGGWSRCSHCQRLNAHYATGVPCPRANCIGQPEEIPDLDAVIGKNFFYQSFSRDLVPLRVEEHTAQLSTDKGREYQEAFKKGYINVLSCSTTFEMGIDLGDLQAVVMSNVPPTVANYRQRAGRAGRRASGTAFILTWTSDNPHDQAYYRHPEGIIQGHVRVPHLAEHNAQIARRHHNALLLSLFLRDMSAESGTIAWKNLGAFFDTHDVEPLYERLTRWTSDASESIHDALTRFGTDPKSTLDAFMQDMAERAENYHSTIAVYKTRNQELGGQIASGAGDVDVTQLSEEITRNQKQIDRLRAKPLIDYLSGRGVLPSYSFPLETVELELYHDKGKDLRLQRDLKLAIREFAPGNEVIADKQVWKSSAVRVRQNTPQVFEYFICPTCNHLSMADNAGTTLAAPGQCKICNELPPLQYKKNQRYLQPDGFVSFEQPKRAKQLNLNAQNLMRSAMLPATDVEEYQMSELVRVGYNQQGRLFYVNEGDIRSSGFFLELKDPIQMGRVITDKAKRKDQDAVTLGHVRTTNSLIIRFTSTPDVVVPEPYEQEFWHSLMYALLNGASRALQIERNDLDGLLFPRSQQAGQWEQTIVLYDNVPGGAGHVRYIQEEFARVVEETLNIVHCTGCAEDTSCYHCLRDYKNQPHHDLLKRGKIIRFLEELGRSLKTDTPYPAVITLNRPYWLMEKVSNARRSVHIAADALSLEEIRGTTSNWLDTLLELRQRGVKVYLYLRQRVLQEGGQTMDYTAFSIARYLHTLLDKGLELYHTQALPEWQILIDPEDDEGCRAISIKTPTAFALTSQALESVEIYSTLRRGEVKQAKQAWDELLATPYNVSWLTPPSTIQVMNYDPLRASEKDESALFSHLFKKPVVQLVVNDPYLVDEARIVERLGAYLKLAGASLRQVKVTTLRASETDRKNNANASQDKGLQKLKTRYSHASIEFKYHRPEHDRWIDLIREDGSKARIIIGAGLDFLTQKKKTFIIIQDPMT